APGSDPDELNEGLLAPAIANCHADGAGTPAVMDLAVSRDFPHVLLQTDDAMLAVSGSIAVRNALGSRQEAIGRHGHTGLEAEHPMQCGRRCIAAPEQVQRNTVRIESRDHRYVAAWTIGSTDNIHRQVDAVKPNPLMLNRLDIGLAFLVVAVQLPAIEEAALDRILEAPGYRCGLGGLLG